MSRALYQLLVEVQKLILLPFKTGASMRATVVISKECCVFVHHKNGLSFTFYFDLKTFAARVFDVGCLAENVCHDVC